MPTKAYAVNDPLGGLYVELDNGTWIPISDVGFFSDKGMIADAIEMWTTKPKEEEKEKVEKKLLGTVKIKYNDQVTKNPLSIDHVIFSGPATIVFWADGDKTIVKCKPGDEYSYDVGIAMATLKKIFGDSYSVYKNDVKRKIKTYEQCSDK